MKKYIIILVCFIGTSPVQGQPRFYSDNDSLFKRTLNTIKEVINRSIYIIEASPIDGGDYYYVDYENQTYLRELIKVNKVFKGSNISVGDTIVGVWKQWTKGKGIPEVPCEDCIVPTLWSLTGDNASCLFFIDNTYPIEPQPDKYSHLRKVTYISSEMGYIVATFNTLHEVGSPPSVKQIPVSIGGVLFDSKQDWYSYLKQYPDIKVPDEK